MTRPPALEIATRLLALLASLSLALTGQVYVPVAAAALAAIGLSLLTTFLPSPRLPGPRFWQVLSMLAFLAFVIDFFAWAESVLQAAVHLLLYLMIYRLFHLDGPKAHLQMCLIAFLQILSAAQYSSGLFFAFSFPLFLLASIWTLLLIHLSRGLPAGQVRANLLTPPFLIFTTALSLVSFFFALAVFFTVPRAGAGLFARGEPEPVHVVGFSEQVDFGSLGPLKKEQQMVLRMTVADYANLPPLPLRIRGVAFDTFDGKAWSARRNAKRNLFRPDTGPFFLPQSPRRGFPVDYQILLEPLKTPILFGLSFPSTVSGDMPFLRVDPQGSVYLPVTPTSRFSYRGSSRLPVITPPDLKIERADYPPEILKGYLQIPPDLAGVEGLARKATGRAVTVHEKVKAVESFLMRNYHYSLDVTTPPGKNPIEDFLFGSKTGYCEHFATAMTLMLRALDIPARLVTGFLPGEWNEFGEYYMVRQSDAHSWVEAYFPGSGWMTFDPTPPTLPERKAWIAGMSRYLDHLRIRWERYIVHYSLPDQMKALTQVKSHTDTLLRLLRDGWGGALKARDFVYGAVLGRPWGWWMLALAILGAGAGLFIFSSRGTRAWSFSGKISEPSAQVYLAMLSYLAARGWTKAPSHTPLEFIRRLPLAPEDLRKIEEITRTYCACRFGGQILSSEQREHMKGLLKSLKSSSSISAP